jgi:hypothetical protein
MIVQITAAGAFMAMQEFFRHEHFPSWILCPMLIIKICNKSLNSIPLILPNRRPKKSTREECVEKK